MSGTEIITRRAARVLVVDAAGRVLMLHGIDPADPSDRYWITVGGGLEDGESYVEGAVRELAEEIGLRVPADRLGEPVWHEVVEFPFNGQNFRQEQVFFLLRVSSWRVDPSGFDEIERAAIDGYRWLAPADLAGTSDPYYPAVLPDLLVRLGVTADVPPHGSSGEGSEAVS
jgi:8-oxo-dGTP pyrophosphatase MutT (NUDIX family)